MTKAEIKRFVGAVIEAARERGVAEVEVKIEEVIVRIPLGSDDKTVAESREIVL
jgi:hypothetical protein